MTEQLQNLCLNSIEDFANLIAQPAVSTPEVYLIFNSVDMY